MQTVKGQCRYCGQNRIVELFDNATDDQIDEEVALTCTCKAAREYQEKKDLEEKLQEAKISAKGTTFELFHEEFPDVEDILNAGIEAITEKRFKNLTIKINDRTKAVLKMSKENIVVQREDKSIYSRETETK